MERFVDVYLQYTSRHTLPVGGGWLDQAAQFVDGVAIADEERGRVLQAKSEPDRQSAVLAKSRARTERMARGA